MTYVSSFSEYLKRTSRTSKAQMYGKEMEGVLIQKNVLLNKTL